MTHRLRRICHTRHSMKRAIPSRCMYTQHGRQRTALLQNTAVYTGSTGIYTKPVVPPISTRHTHQESECISHNRTGYRHTDVWSDGAPTRTCLYRHGRQTRCMKRMPYAKLRGRQYASRCTLKPSPDIGKDENGLQRQSDCNKYKTLLPPTAPRYRIHTQTKSRKHPSIQYSNITCRSRLSYVPIANRT